MERKLHMATPAAETRPAGAKRAKVYIRTARIDSPGTRQVTGTERVGVMAAVGFATT